MKSSYSFISHNRLRETILKKINPKTTFFILPTFFFSVLTAQHTIKNPEFVNWFDAQVGIENTGLINGIEFAEKYRTINDKTPFLISPNFLKGNVCYDGQWYFDLDMRYDVFEDEVFIKLPNRLGGTTLNLIKDKISRFKIDDHYFVKLKGKNTKDEPYDGFFEPIFESGLLTLYIKEEKKRLKQKDRDKIYYEYVDARKKHLLWYKNQMHELTNKKDFMVVFPELKKEINAFYKSARSLKNSDYDAFMIGLVKKLNSLSSVEKTVE